MSEDSRARYILRPEARPLHWSQLNASQQAAFLRILQALDEARDDLDNRHGKSGMKNRLLPPNLPSQADPLRSSRLIFLSGQRGTGKSTVLISLFNAFCKDEEIAEEIVTSPRERRAELERQAELKRRAKIEGLVGRLRHRLVWLEPLDMEPLPRPTNLLAAILARIDQSVCRFGQLRDDSPQTKTGLLNQPTIEQALHRLRKLGSDVAIAWDGNVEDRSAHLDPDAYADEVNRVEEARLRINQRLDSTLDDLAAELEKLGAVRNPFFVLPVDDYDLNPLRALDLMRLIRVISSPRLFILVLGDVRMAEVIFNLKQTGEFATVLRDAHGSDYLSLSAGEIASMARALSGHAIRKLVPPGQRLALGPMKVEEALAFHPAKLQDKSLQAASEKTTTLQALLGKLPVDVETAEVCRVRKRGTAKEVQCIGGKEIGDFKDFLLFNLNQDATHDGAAPGQDQDRAVYPYTGSLLLKATPRYIMDLWFSLEQFLDEQAQVSELERLNQLVERIGQETHRAVEEDTLLSIRYRERLVDALGVGPDEGWLQAMKFVEARSLSVPGRHIAFRLEDCVLHANYQRSWTFWDLDERKPIDVDERTKALLILLHDLLTLEKGRGIVGSHALSPDSLNLGWAYASWDTGLPEEVTVQWITPAWTSFWELEQFSHVWQQALHGDIWINMTDESTQRAFLAYVWISTAVKILGRKEDVENLTLIPESEEKVHFESELWEQLADSLLNLFKNVDPKAEKARTERIHGWFTRLPVLLAPESGFMVSNEIGVARTYVHRVLKDPGVRAFYEIERISAKVRRLRADHLAPFATASALLDNFLKGDHVINSALPGRFTPSPEEMEEARQRAIRRGTIGPVERIAAALEGLAPTLRGWAFRNGPAAIESLAADEGK